jgi:peptidoglycan LD-endopeptidase LytH
MKRTLKERATVLPALAACLFAGIVIGWLLRSAGAPRPAAIDSADAADAPSAAARTAAPAVGAQRGQVPASTDTRGIVPTSGTPPSSSGAPLPAAAAVADLRQHGLSLPIEGAKVESMKGGFDERRDDGGRPHEAVDILAPRNTPIHAVDDGVVAKLFQSKAGGTTIYQYDPSGRYCYYYAHLERYADGLRDGQHLARGDVIGYVGTSGNAPPDTPHLHFAVFELTAARQWWKGLPLDPYLIFRP